MWYHFGDHKFENSFPSATILIMYSLFWQNFFYILFCFIIIFIWSVLLTKCGINYCIENSFAIVVLIRFSEFFLFWWNDWRGILYIIFIHERICRNRNWVFNSLMRKNVRLWESCFLSVRIKGKIVTKENFAIKISMKIQYL